MRITNKVMQNNALTNINKNKEMQDSLNTQLSTGKKIYKPSEDPVTAIRALRLRSDVSQVSQYYKKNAPDANSWLELTESSIKTTVSVVRDMIVQCEKGSNDTLTTSDRQTIINSLKQLKEEVYTTGDADYAGRYIFAGYRTDTSISFPENTTQTYKITELFSADDIVEDSYINTGNLTSLSESNFKTGTTPLVTEQDIRKDSYYKIRLAYNNIDADTFPASIKMNNVNYAVTKFDNKEDAYKYAATNAAGVGFIPSTGEFVFGQTIFDNAKNEPDKIQITYDKTNWLDGDLRPQHYFYCETEVEGKKIVYNDDDFDGDGKMDYFTNGKVDQEIEYQVGFSQYIRVNTNANEIYKHDIGRDVDELINLANQLEKAESMQKKLSEMSENTSLYKAEDIDLINENLDGIKKAVAYLKDEMHKKFASTITSMQSYLDDTNEAISLVGNRSSRLSLISNRLDSQTTTFKTLQSENEDADATEVAVQLSSAKISYQAALMATSDMIQETLLNYL